MKYIISTDSTADLPASYVKEHDIAIQFLSYAFGDTVYGLNNQLDPHDFLRPDAFRRNADYQCQHSGRGTE